MTNADTLLTELRSRLPDPLPPRLGVAVSGGSDSTALLHLLSQIARESHIELHAATVDHGLRPNSSDEAKSVAELARSWGIPHQTLQWQGWDGSGNLQDQARQARYRLLTDWAKSNSLTAIALGHTEDDQAETVLMRLARSSGVSGLSAMSGLRRENGIDLLRPLLATSRAALRNHLIEAGISWFEDPSNQDTRFDRIRMRNALSELDQIGISTHALSRVAENLAQAREALAQYAQDAARCCIQCVDGALRFDRDAFARYPIEIRRRLLVAGVLWIAGDGYPPRNSAIQQGLLAIETGQTATIGGCILLSEGKKTWLCRELNAVRDLVAQPGDLWDRRWKLTGPDDPNSEIRALGADGILQVEDWRASGKPRAVLMASPAVWSGDQVISAPLAGFGNGWTAQITQEWPDFYSSILSH